MYIHSYIYILYYINILNINRFFFLKYIHACVCIYMHVYINIHSIHILCKQKHILDLICIYIYIHTHTLTGHFFRYTLLVPGWTPFCLQNCLNYSWHRFNKVLETFLRDFGPYWHDSIMQLLQICQLHIHDGNLPFHHIPKVLYWIEIWWLWSPFE